MGNRTSMTTDQGTTTYEYDAGDRMTRAGAVAVYDQLELEVLINENSLVRSTGIPCSDHQKFLGLSWKF